MLFKLLLSGFLTIFSHKHTACLFNTADPSVTLISDLHEFVHDPLRNRKCHHI